MEIKATDVKKLREKTGAGMMDCKKALVEAGGDEVKAEKILKELGLAAAQKRAGRAAKEGRIISAIEDDRAALVDLSCETDFVAKAQDFKDLGNSLVKIALQKGETDSKPEIEQAIQEAVAKIKEKIELRRLRVLEAAAMDILVDYIHGDGRIGVVVKLSVSDEALKDNERVREVAFDLALHTAAFAPRYLTRENVEADYIKEQEDIFLKQAENLGKPEKVLQGIVKGKLNKHLGEICFLDQPFVKDQTVKVSKVLADLGKEVGGSVEITDYVYFKVGD